MHWILDFLGINNTYNSFSTHMYNFWSGFGSNIGILAIVTTVIGVYRHNSKQIEKKTMDIFKAPIHLVQHNGQDGDTSETDKTDNTGSTK
jgi:hypothetical protein